MVEWNSILWEYAVFAATISNIDIVPQWGAAVKTGCELNYNRAVRIK